ncbi:MAG: cysteine hydrolase [Candidatus Bipolaricaulis sp.]|nr:cysteine hydrolase [Candidatus Bipolaricaulis sp.]MDD5219423.1 cysteine hydrolase [Candidatus Bipolaricaulis sp.]MDD5646794.1 cysteine hydrolase [Candidatus Bipolaricaulis sp.]
MKRNLTLVAGTLLALSLVAQAERIQTPSCTTALLIIDVQRIWMVGDLRTTDGVWITDAVMNVLERTRPAGIHVIYVQDVSRSTAGERLLGFPDAIAPQSGDHVSSKTQGNAFAGTTLQALLESLGVRRLLICGLASQSCVSATVAGARSRGYDVVILANAHASGDGGIQAAQMNSFWANQGMTVVTIADLDVASLCP